VVNFVTLQVAAEQAAGEAQERLDPIQLMLDASPVVKLVLVLLIAMGLVTRVGAAVATMPRPIVGGLYCALFGLISAVGIQQLSRANLKSDRTLLIAGFSLFMGLSVPVSLKNLATGALTPRAEWLIGVLHAWIPHAKTAQTLADIVIAVGSSGMAVAAILGLVLDNLIPGSASDRGLDEETSEADGPEAAEGRLVATEEMETDTR